MSNITWVNSSELDDFDKLFKARQDFTLYGTVEKISNDGSSVKVRLFDPAKKWFGVWMSVSEDFDLEALKDSQSPLIAFTAKIETFLGKDKRYITKVTLTNWTDAESEPESTELTLENVTIVESLPVDQKGLFQIKFQTANPDNKSEFYHIRWYDPALKDNKTLNKITFKLGITKHQIDENGIRKTGIETFSYQREDGETVTGDRPVYRLCLNLESI